MSHSLLRKGCKRKAEDIAKLAGETAAAKTAKAMKLARKAVENAQMKERAGKQGKQHFAKLMLMKTHTYSIHP